MAIRSDLRQYTGPGFDINDFSLATTERDLECTAAAAPVGVTVANRGPAWEGWSDTVLLSDLGRKNGRLTPGRRYAFGGLMKGRRFNRRVLGRATVLVGSALRISAFVRELKKRRVREIELIESSGLLDPEWYLSAYPDVAQARVKPVHHYMTTGWREGRDPGPDFATSSYLKANPDVALAGVNPLLHFIEFGHQEGRGLSRHRPRGKQLTPVAYALGPAAACVTFSQPEEPPIRWIRGYSLARRSDLLCVGDCVIGYVPNDVSREALESSFSLLEELSGYRSRPSGAERPRLPSAERLVDAWFVNAAQVRTRWQSEGFPVVVRAFQHDPQNDGMLSLVGEGLVASPLDPLDLHLQNPFLPVLVVFAAPDGTVRGARLLAFPSLCRGGVHYAELLQSGEMDAATAGELLAKRLLRLSSATVRPAIARIEVELEESDGRGQLFQPQFQLWLTKVCKISVAPTGASRSRAGEFVEQAVSVHPSGGGREGGAILRINHDMIPTIAALVEPEGTADGSARKSSPPLLVTPHAREPFLAIQFPGEELPMPQLPPHHLGARRLRVVVDCGLGLREGLPAAIAFPTQRHTSDATLLVPIANATVPTAPRSAITWVVDTRGWPEGGLAEAVHAIGLQIGGAGDCLSFVGASDPLAHSVARNKIAGAVNSFDNLDAAIAAAQTPVIAFVGPGVLLHDTRTAAVLASFLDEQMIATVSCAIVEVNQSGAHSHVTIADPGTFSTSPGSSLGAGEQNALSEFLWSTNYPVLLPGRHLWLARKATIAEWLKPSRGHTKSPVHICSSELTASHVGRESPAQVPTFVPRAADEHAIRVRALLG